MLIRKSEKKDLSEKIRKAIDGQEVDFRDNKEGCLSILKNDIHTPVNIINERLNAAEQEHAAEDGKAGCRLYMEVLAAKDLTKTYVRGDTAVTALKNVSFQVDKGEFIAIIGASGSGREIIDLLLAPCFLQGPGCIHTDLQSSCFDHYFGDNKSSRFKTAQPEPDGNHKSRRNVDRHGPFPLFRC